RDLAETQMHAFDPGRINEDLVERPRQRHGVKPAARKLDGDEVLRVSTGVDLVEVGADRRLDRIDEATQDAVLVEALHASQRGLDRTGELGLPRPARVRANI